MSHEIQEMPDLINGRSLHAMTWLDNKPAVIGGSGLSNEGLSSVEVFGSDKWEESKPLLSKRYGLSACNLKNAV